MRWFLPSIVLMALLAWAVPAQAGGGSTWIFDPSYYSHDPVQHVRVATPQVPGGPYYSRPQGDYVRGGYRWMNAYITVGGQTFDHVHVVESWVQAGEQY